jgi:hypothetical protein
MYTLLGVLSSYFYSVHAEYWVVLVYRVFNCYVYPYDDGYRIFNLNFYNKIAPMSFSFFSCIGMAQHMRLCV